MRTEEKAGPCRFVKLAAEEPVSLFARAGNVAIRKELQALNARHASVRIELNGDLRPHQSKTAKLLNHAGTSSWALSGAGVAKALPLPPHHTAASRRAAEIRLTSLCDVVFLTSRALP